jgi:hypothetical protein
LGPAESLRCALWSFMHRLNPSQANHAEYFHMEYASSLLFEDGMELAIAWAQHRLPELAGEPFARQAEAVDGAEDRGGDMVGLEELARQALHIFAGDRFDRRQDLIERGKAVKV